VDAGPGHHPPGRYSPLFAYPLNNRRGDKIEKGQRIVKRDKRRVKEEHDEEDGYESILSLRCHTVQVVRHQESPR
jgi:hypothetical protein